MPNHISDYLTGVQSLLGKISAGDIQRIVNLLHDTRMNRHTVYLCGNGGSAATASHWANDLCKGTLAESLPRLRAIALTDNVPLMTAWANDSAYENIFASQLANYVQPLDIVIGISGSGNSRNVLNAIRCARQEGALTIGLSGFDGVKLKGLADFCIVVPSNSMEQVEDAHLILTHAISTALRQFVVAARPRQSPVVLNAA